MDSSVCESVDLLEICCRAVSAWQYIDPKLTTAKLRYINKNVPYPTSDSLSITHNLCDETVATLTCTKFTLHDNITRKPDRDAISTVKNFFNLPLFQCVRQFKKKQLIYWMIRLRNTSGIIPVAILEMITDLRMLGFSSWRLPDGQTVSFSSVWLGELVIAPSQLNIMETKYYEDGDHVQDITEPVEVIEGCDGANMPCVDHCVLVIKLNPDDTSFHILDPTSLQFQLVGHDCSLIIYTTKADYAAQFPGHISSVQLDELESESRLREKWRSEKQPRNHCNQLIQEIIRNLKKAACGHCGEVESNGRNIKLLSCMGCKRIKYCDKFCQKINWKSHKDRCNANPTIVSTCLTASCTKSHPLIVLA